MARQGRKRNNRHRGCLHMTKRNRDRARRGTGDSTAGSGQLTSPQAPAAAKWKMAIATFVGAYIVTAIAIPRELSWLPHSWSFYEINIFTNIIMATAMTWAILPGMSRLLRRWLYGSHGVPVLVAARRPGPAALAATRRAGMVTVHVAAAVAQTASRNKGPARRGRDT
jgi:hypothetical protein